LNEPLAEQTLSWAAKLHEIGLDISHAHYHRHGAYLLENSDMRVSTRRTNAAGDLGGCTSSQAECRKFARPAAAVHLKAESLIVVLRLAVLLHRGRSAVPLPEMKITARVPAWNLSSRRVGWMIIH